MEISTTMDGASAVVAGDLDRAGDSPVALSELAVRTTDGNGTPLEEEQATDLFTSIGVYLDEGSGVFEPGVDAPIVSVTDLSSITTNGNGILTVSLPADDDKLQVSHGTPRTYLVTVKLTADADQQIPGAFAFEHLTEPGTAGTKAQDAAANIPATLELTANVAGQRVETAFTQDNCHSPMDLNLEELTVDAALVCEAGTVLRAGRAVTVRPSGTLTLRAGTRVVLSDGFEIETGGNFSAEIDPRLKPVQIWVDQLP